MHYQTRKKAISPEVKQAVYERDGGQCVICGKRGLPNAHFISRAHGGLGVEQNIVTLCRECHDRYDNSIHRKAIREVLRAYLKSKYPEWDEEKLNYHKYEGGLL